MIITGRLMIQRSILAFIIISLAIHFGFVSSLVIFGDSPAKKQETIVVDYIKTSPTKKRQIVEQQKKALNDEVPDEEYFLAQHNQVVKKQTKANNTGEFRNTNGQNSKPKNSKKNTQKQARTKPGQMPTLQDLTPQLNTEIFSTGLSSQSDDYLKDVEASSETLLSTREFLYYSYFNRIKTKLRQHWGRKIKAKVHKLVRKGRNIASVSDRITKVIIVLNAKGTLVKVQVQSPSGIHDLDAAAVEAFREAAPFPNPPRGMIEGDGHVKIHWDFVLEA